MGKGVKILHQDCDASLGQDRSLPYTAYLVEYMQDGITKFDIVTAAKRVDIFDYYWDLYRSDFRNMTQSEGRANPKLWQNRKIKRQENKMTIYLDNRAVKEEKEDELEQQKKEAAKMVATIVWHAAVAHCSILSTVEFYLDTIVFGFAKIGYLKS